MKTGGNPGSNSVTKISKMIWDEFVYGSHLLALGDALVIVALSIILGINITWSLPVVVYMSVLAINSYNRYKEFDQDLLTNPERSNKMRKYIKIFPYLISILLLSSMVIVYLTATKQALIFMFVLFVLGLLYTTLFKGWTKKVIGFKNFSIALPYSLMVIFLALYYNSPITMAVILVSIFYYLRIFISAMYFDVKDIESDHKEGLKTFAATFGEKKNSNLLMVLNILSVVPLLIAVYCRILPMYSLMLLVTVLYSSFYILELKDKKYNRQFLFNVVADGEFLFWLAYILIGKALL